MKRLLMMCCAALIAGGSAMAQNVLPTLEDLIPGGATYRQTQNIYGLQWWGDVCIKPDIESISAVNPKNGKETVLVDKETVNKALEAKGLSKISHFYTVKMPWAGEKKILIQLTNHYVAYDIDNDEAVVLHEFDHKAANYDFNAAGKHLAYTIDNNLLVDGRQVTDEPQGVVCGQSVHRNEFGINKGTFWSPKGSLLAFYRMDERMVTEYPLVDTSTRIAELNNIRYPMAGMTSHLVQVGVYNPATHQTVYLNAGDPTDRYFTNISWSPDEKFIYLIEVNRDQNHAKLCRYDAQSGELQAVLFEETHPKYVEPQQPIVFLPWDDNVFIYQSQQSGYNHLYLYNTDGKLIRPLTKGDWLVKEIVGFNAKNKEVLLLSTERSPLQSNLYKVRVSDGKRVRLEKTEGVHQAVLSASGTYVIDAYFAPEIPRNIDVTEVQSGKSINLLTADNPYRNFRMPSIETGTMMAADGQTELHYRLIKPVDFDPNKKYPAIIYVYGGPHAQMIMNGFMYAARGWDLYMATQGYVMFTVDNRGSSNRGLEFENCTFRQLGIEESKDQLAGAEFLKSLPYVDAEAIGVHGWSFGGHMTTSLMLRYPETFKVGVAGGPVIDWQYYEIMYGERYMDRPQDNPEGYEACNLNNLAGNLTGHLLMIHDDHDDTCVPQHTLSFIKACVDARVYPDLFIYPGHKHNVLGRDRVHLHEKITQYFKLHLPVKE